jgi:hypothetical protein
MYNVMYIVYIIYCNCIVESFVWVGDGITVLEFLVWSIKMYYLVQMSKLILCRMRCRRGTAGKAAESLNVGGVSGGGHMTAAGAGPLGGKTSEVQVTGTSGGRSINVEREVSINGEFFFTVKPLNNKHIGGKAVVCCREVVPISEVGRAAMPLNSEVANC